MAVVSGAQIRGLFAQEAEGRLSALGALLLQLEQSGSDASVVDSIFRELHTIKGSAAVAGLTDVSVETISETLEFSSGAQMWDWVTNSNPIGRMIVSDLSEDQRSSVRRVLDDMLRGRANGSGSARLTNPINIGIGTR